MFIYVRVKIIIASVKKISRQMINKHLLFLCEGIMVRKFLNHFGSFTLITRARSARDEIV